MESEEVLREALTGGDSGLGAAKCIFVGFSGGLDSTVLLHVAAQAYPGRVTALHAHHGLHGDADAWLAHCQRICETWTIPLRSRRLSLADRGHGLEAAARDARYAWFESEVQASDHLLLAHHLDDQAETVLLRLLRGAGPDGLAGMPQRRTLGAAALSRPFLSLPRAHLQAYAESQGLAWIEDPSNGDSSFDRNYLRNEVLPLLEARWPGYRKTFGRAAKQLRALTADTLPAALDACASAVGEPGFVIDSLPASRDLAARAIRYWLKGLGLPMPSAGKLHEFQRQLDAGQGASLAAGSYVLTRYREAVFCHSKDVRSFKSPVSLVPGAALSLPGAGTLRVECDDDAPASDPLFLRTRQDGDTIAAPDGHRRSLKTVFQDAGVPPWWRSRTPILCSGEGADERILAVGGFCVSPEAIERGLRVFWAPDLGLSD